MLPKRPILHNINSRQNPMTLPQQPEKFSFHNSRFIGTPPQLRHSNERLKKETYSIFTCFVMLIKGMWQLLVSMDRRLEILDTIWHSTGTRSSDLFVTLSYVKLWWPDLKRSPNGWKKHGTKDSHQIHQEWKLTGGEEVNKHYPLYINNFFVKRVTHFSEQLWKTHYE